MTDHARALQLAVCAGIVAFALAFAYPSVHAQAVLWYDPIADDWAYRVRGSGAMMDFYGRCLLATVACGVAGGASYALFRRLAVRGAWLGLATAWAITVTLLVMADYSWTLYFRHPVPLR